MICSNCPNSNYKNTGVPSCFLPHCLKPIEALGKRYAQLFMRPRTSEEEAEYKMIGDEIKYAGLRKKSTTL